MSIEAKSKDIHNLTLQFWTKVHMLDGSAFQSFCEFVFQEAFADFRKVRPYRDGGNDGFRESIGEYYQMYAPENPQSKMADAAEKLKVDFYKLQNEWGEFSKIKSYKFVFNDKNRGTTNDIEKALAELREEFSEIEFSVLDSNNLLKMLLCLDGHSLLNLGFNVDSTLARSTVLKFLEYIDKLLDQEQPALANAALQGIVDAIPLLKDEELQLRYEITHCRTLILLEKHIDSMNRLVSLTVEYPDKPELLLQLAELYLRLGEAEKNKNIIDQVSEIDDTNLQLQLQRLAQSISDDTDNIEPEFHPSQLPSDARMKSQFLRLQALAHSKQGDFAKANGLIQQAIALNPNRVQNYVTHILIHQEQIIAESGNATPDNKSILSHLSEIEDIGARIEAFGPVTHRVKAILDGLRIPFEHMRRNIPMVECIAERMYDNITKCVFDTTMESVLFTVLRAAICKDDLLNEILSYLSNPNQKRPTYSLGKELLAQMLYRNWPLSTAREYFEECELHEILELIEKLEQGDLAAAAKYIGDDAQFKVRLATSARQLSQFREYLILELSEEGFLDKDKALLLLRRDEGRIDDAFALMTKIDLHNLSYIEAHVMLEIAKQKKAWDYLVPILRSLLQFEKSDIKSLEYEILQFDSLLHLENHRDAAVVGNALLENERLDEVLTREQIEVILHNTLMSHLKRRETGIALRILEKHKARGISADFFLSIAVTIYLEASKPEDAMNAIISGLTAIGTPTQEHFGELFYVTARLSNMLEISPDSDESIDEDKFVKLSNSDRWYHIGYGRALDATQVSRQNKLYSLLKNKKLGDLVTVESEFSSRSTSHRIEAIFSIAKYICWQSANSAQRLTRENRWDKMAMIEIPTKDNIPELKYLKKFLAEGKSQVEPIFQLYRDTNIPLAVLASATGGLIEAIGLIANERMGYVRSCPNARNEILAQFQIARDIINGKEFLIDGTTALVLCESGYLGKLKSHLPAMHIPQSVISFLQDIRARIAGADGESNFLQYAQNELRLSKIEGEYKEVLEKRFEDSIALLETEPDCILQISQASKSDVFSESKIPGYLCDACILAQRRDYSILTEDYLYVQLNAYETTKSQPRVTSAISLMRAMYELGRVTFDEYLELFYYLSTYRARFLQISVSDMIKAVFGDRDVTLFRPEQLRRFNFRLTLSEEYGVSRRTAFAVCTQFLVTLLLDDVIPIEYIKRIFREILNEVEFSESRLQIGQELLDSCRQLGTMKQQFVVVSSGFEEKLELLSQFN